MRGEGEAFAGTLFSFELPNTIERERSDPSSRDSSSSATAFASPLAQGRDGIGVRPSILICSSRLRIRPCSRASLHVQYLSFNRAKRINVITGPPSHS